MKFLGSVLILLSLLLMPCGCRDRQPASPPADSGKLRIVTTLFPLYDFARSIAGERAEVTLLLPPGVEPHSFEPRPEDMIRISKADIFIYTSEQMEPWAQRLLKGVASPTLLVIDASRGISMQPTGHDHAEGPEHRHDSAGDPHIWLDFENAAQMVATIAAGMAQKSPQNAAFFNAGAAAYQAELHKLDNDFKAGLAACQRREFLHGGHYAFGYLARRYGLSYQSAQAINPDAEPTPARIAALLRQLRTNGSGYVFSEELLSPRTAEMLSRETGARILPLHAAHNISREDLAAGVRFTDLMHRNLDNLRTGLGCR